MVLLSFVLGSLFGALAGGVLCARHLRSALLDELGPRLERIYADLDPQIRAMQNQLNLIEAAVNIDLATRYVEKGSIPPRPPVIPAARPGEVPVSR